MHADEGEDLIRAHIASDEGAARLGEAALVDRSSRVGQTGLVFYDTLFDENAASHIALGSAILQCVPGAAALSSRSERRGRGINKSSLHTDFMIGVRASRCQRRDQAARRCRSSAAAPSCSRSRLRAPLRGRRGIRRVV